MELVYQEQHETIEQAERREYQVKHWTRAKKEALIRADLNQLKSLSRRKAR